MRWMCWAIGAAVACGALAAAGCAERGDTPLARLDPGIEDRVAAKIRRLEIEGPKPANAPDEALRFFMDQRLGAGADAYPIRRVQQLNADLAAREARAAVDRSSVAGLSSWAPLGPGNIGGRTRALVIDPTDPDVIYAGGATGGVWKTTDAGQSWIALDDAMLNLAIASLVMDPNDPSTLYAGTGEGVFGNDTHRGLGIFKTTDAGATWSQLPATDNPDFFFVNSLVISPGDSDRVYAGTRAGVMRSLDAGASWTLVHPSASIVGCTDLEIRQDVSPDTILAAFGSFRRDGLFRSTDGGDSWTRLGTVANLQGFRQGRMEIALAPSDNDVVYVSMASNGTGLPVGRMVDVYRSLDGGDTWEARLTLPDPNNMNPWLLSNLQLANGCFGTATYDQGWYDHALAVDPLDPEVVWIAGIDVFRSDDGGQSFAAAGYWWLDRDTFAQGVHADGHALVFDPGYDGSANTRLYFTNDGGVYRTEDATAATSTNGCPQIVADLGGVLWTPLNNGYGVTQFYHGDSSDQVDRFAGGTQDNGTNLVDSIATPDDWATILGGDGGYTLIDPTNPDVIYAETQFFPQIRKSIDGGVSFFFAVTGITDTTSAFIVPIAMSPQSPGILWTGGYRPWRTLNGASTWTLAVAGNPGDELDRPWPQADVISAIAPAPGSASVVYIGFADGHVARTTTALSATPSWTLFDASNGLPAEQGWISSIAVDPTDPDVAYATSSTFGIDHIYRTMDGGVTWTSIDGVAEAGIPDIPVHWLAVRPSDPRQLYAGTESGVFASEDRGATWHPANAGAARTIVETLDFQDADTLIAFTHGRGAFRAALTPSVDCDASGLADTWEIETGALRDCDDDQIPDACDDDCACCCIGDIDDDGDTDVFDFGDLVAAFGSSTGDPGWNPAADLVADGVIDVFDFAAFTAGFGCGAS